MDEMSGESDKLDEDVEDEDRHCSKLDLSDLKILRKAYGISVSWYLNNPDVVSRKTVSGAFILSTHACLNTCRELISNKAELEATRGKTKIHTKKKAVVLAPTNKPKASSHLTPANAKPAINCASELPKYKSNNVPVQQELFRKSSTVAYLTINFRSESKKIRATLPPPISFSCLTERHAVLRIEGTELYELMMKTYIGNHRIFGYKACRIEIGLILTEFYRRHGKFQYYTFLRNILKRTGGKKSKDVLEITLKQYQEFMYNVFASVIPSSLFGCHKNAKVLRKALKAYYLSPYEASLCLTPYINSLNISSIKWLDAVKDINTRWSIIAKIIKWFFAEFFFPLFKALFHQQKSLYNEKRIMMSAERWKRFQREYIDCQLREGRIAKVDPDDDFRMQDRPSGRMILYPKSKGVRPIYRFRYTDEQREKIGTLTTFLQQQYLQRHDFVKIEKLHATWLTYVTATEENANRKVNLVTCDVSDAFGSIIREKLFDIINRMIDEIPEENLALQWYQVILPTRKGRKLDIQYKRWFSSLPESPFVRNRSLVATSAKSEHKVVYVTKTYIRAQLAAHILEQNGMEKFEFKGTEYKLTKGIIQGSQLSSILSDIYYEHMKVEVFETFMKSGTLLRYVDDFIYITNNEESAKRFLKAIKNNVPEYGCHFQNHKIQTNVKSRNHDKCEWVKYLGFKLNGSTMEIRPHYSDAEFQFLSSMKTIALKNSLKKLIQRSKDFTTLKLDPMVLDRKINSLRGLCVSAELAANRLATRCVILVSTIFEDPTQYRDSIMNQIQAITKKLEKTFIQALTASDRANSPNFRKLLSIGIWQAFYRVFSRNLKLRKLFGKEMKRMVKTRTVL